MAQVTLKELYSAKKSIQGRLSRLKRTPGSWRRRVDQSSPIARIGVFSDEIDSMERTLESMRDRLNNAKINIEV